MTANFGSAWKTRFRDKDDFGQQIRVWARTVEPFGPAVVDQALQRVTGLASSYPPTLPEFVALCREVAIRGQVFKPLPKPKPTREVAEAAIANMRRSIAEKADAVARKASEGPTVLCDMCGVPVTIADAIPRRIAGALCALCPVCAEVER